MGIVDKARDLAAASKLVQSQQREADAEARRNGTAPLFTVPCESASGAPSRLCLFDDRIEFEVLGRRGRPSTSHLFVKIADVDSIAFEATGSPGIDQVRLVMATAGGPATMTLPRSVAVTVQQFVGPKIMARKAKTAASSVVPSGGSVADEVKKLADLFFSGAITKREFAAQKKRLLGE